MRPDIAVPLAYFITFTSYGSWLHGERPSSVDRFRNIPETPFVSSSFKRASLAKKSMLETPFILSALQRQVVLKTIVEVCQYRNWVLLAAHVRSNHVHMIVHSLLPPEQVMNTIKAYASRQLNQNKTEGIRSKWWTRHGSTLYLWDEAEVEATIQYVVHEQGSTMAAYENNDRSFEKNSVF